MLTNIFDEIKSRISAKQAAEFYGIEVDRHGRARCIWHEPDEHPSLSFKDGFCKCFACGSGGSAIDVTMQIFNITAKEAANKLNADFCLEIEECKTAISPMMDVQTSERVILNAFETWKKNSLETVNEYCNLLYRAKHLLPPQDLTDELHPLFIEFLQNTAASEYYFSILMYGTQKEKIAFFKLNRKAVKQIENRLCYWRNEGSFFLGRDEGSFTDCAAAGE